MITKLIQPDINKLWEVRVKSQLGSDIFICLEQPKQGDPTLKRPYQFVLPIKKCAALFESLRGYFEELYQKKPRILQCPNVARKSVKCGMRMNVFMLGYAPGFIGDESGCSFEQWRAINEIVWSMIQEVVGEDYQILPYVEDWTKERKFQARWETYFKYTEML